MPKVAERLGCCQPDLMVLVVKGSLQDWHYLWTTDLAKSTYCLPSDLLTRIQEALNENWHAIQDIEVAERLGCCDFHINVVVALQACAKRWNGVGVANFAKGQSCIHPHLPNLVLQYLYQCRYCLSAADVVQYGDCVASRFPAVALQLCDGTH